MVLEGSQNNAALDSYKLMDSLKDLLGGKMSTPERTTATDHADDPSIDQPVPMTPEQKFFFDLRGWMLLLAVLSPPEFKR